VERIKKLEELKIKEELKKKKLEELELQKE